jgi:2-epi-5-epi-valiolone synthase
MISLSSPTAEKSSFEASFLEQYEVIRSCNAFEPGNRTLIDVARCTPGARRFLVTDDNVRSLYGEQIGRYFEAHDVEIHIHAMESGEQHKTLASVIAIIEALEEFGIRRFSDPIIAVGGGVVTDTVGLAAHLYRRGTPYVRVPTTLVGLVDAGIGLKVGVNFGGSKNIIGSFHSPLASIIDRTFLSTLPGRHVSNGLAEVIKIAIACDHELFELIESALQGDLPSSIDDNLIAQAIAAMLGQLQANPRERELRRAVDFGHTFSPGLEIDSAGELLHGESVALDMALSCGIAVRRRLLSNQSAARIVGALVTSGLPLDHRLCTPPRLRRGLEQATRHRDGSQHLFLPTRIGGGVFVEDVSSDEIAAAVGWASGAQVANNRGSQLFIDGALDNSAGEKRRGLADRGSDLR